VISRFDDGNSRERYGWAKLVRFETFRPALISRFEGGLTLKHYGQPGTDLKLLETCRMLLESQFPSSWDGGCVRITVKVLGDLEGSRFIGSTALHSMHV